MFVFFWGFLSLAIGVSIFSEEIIFLIFGGKYTYAHQALSVYMFTGPAISMMFLISQKFILEHKTKHSLFGYTFGAVVNIVLNLVLVPIMGIKGAALATVIATIMPIASVAIFMDRNVGIMSLQSIFYFKGFVKFYRDYR